MTIRFSSKLVPELFQPFWAALQAGEFLTDAAGVSLTRIAGAVCSGCARQVVSGRGEGVT